MSRLLERLDALLKDRKGFKAKDCHATEVVKAKETLDAPSLQNDNSTFRHNSAPLWERRLFLVSALFLAVLVLGIKTFYSVRKTQDVVPALIDGARLLRDANDHALELLKSGTNDSEALKEYAKLTGLATENPRIFINFAMALKRTGDIKRAREMLERALALDPSDPIAHNNLALIDLEMGLSKSALGHLQRAVELDPTSKEVRLNLARAYETNENYSAALENFQQYIKLSTTDSPAIKNQIQERIRRLSSLAIHQKNIQVGTLLDAPKLNHLRSPAGKVER